MTAYLTVVRVRIRMLLQYRAAAIAGFATQLFWGIMRVMIFDAFYHSTSAVQPMSWEQTVDYLWLTQAMLALLPWSIDSEIRDMIREGTVAYELARPIDLYWFWFSRNIAMRAAPLMLRSLPMFILAGLFFGLHPPASIESALCWLLSVLVALLLGAAITTLMSIAMMYTLAGDGIARLTAALVNILSGSIVPLLFFPSWMQQALSILPFRGLMDTPFRLYMGSIPPSGVFGAVGHQLLWTAGLALLGRWLLSRATRRLVVQGG